MPLQLYAQFEHEESGRGFTCAVNGEYVAPVIRGSGKAALFDMGMKRLQWIRRVRMKMVVESCMDLLRLF
ncbi:hypothetical protein DCAR_0100694 [Daucus carota subsp. sativus]|uniref:Uncharacterized protein n=1 Tax=Daucus carota subsp. sativus TaxID=79200 RepID=A0A166FUU1_DAUCS|nr:hypothetical protein DCAR_0100694 [Daucus carota subsp. sativus]